MASRLSSAAQASAERVTLNMVKTEIKQVAVTGRDRRLASDSTNGDNFYL